MSPPGRFRENTGFMWRRCTGETEIGPVAQTSPIGTKKFANLRLTTAGLGLIPMRVADDTPLIDVWGATSEPTRRRIDALSYLVGCRLG